MKKTTKQELRKTKVLLKDANEQNARLKAINKQLQDNNIELQNSNIASSKYTLVAGFGVILCCLKDLVEQFCSSEIISWSTILLPFSIVYIIVAILVLKDKNDERYQSKEIVDIGEALTILSIIIVASQMLILNNPFFHEKAFETGIAIGLFTSVIGLPICILLKKKDKSKCQ